MRKIQVWVPEDDLAALRQLAEADGISLSAMTRRGIKWVIQEKGKRSRRELMEQALEVAGKFDSGLTDIGRRHDDYLAEAAAEEGR